MTDDNLERKIAAWIRSTEALAERLMVSPSEVYDTLIERGYTGGRKRNTVPTEVSVAFVASLFRPEEILPVHEVVRRFESNPNRMSTTDPTTYVKAILSRHSGERGRRRFTRVGHGAYRLQLSNAELRRAILEELAAQRTFVGSRRLMELFDISYDRLLEVLGPLVGQGKVVSASNSVTGRRDWCLQRYAEVFSR